MKHAVAFILLILLSQSILYYTFFSISLIRTRTAAAELVLQAAENNQSQPYLIKVAVPSLDKDETEEAWYQQQLYDVVSRKVIHDTAYVFLLRDAGEQELISDNFNFFNNTSSSTCGMAIICNAGAHSLQGPGDLVYTRVDQAGCCLVFPAQHTLAFPVHDQRLKNHPREIPVPPPQSLI